MSTPKRRATADPSTGLEPQVRSRRTQHPRLALREIHGHVTVTDTTLTAWYVLGAQRWAFTTDAQRERLIYNYGRRLAALAGRTIHLRVTSRPYPARKWAQTLHQATPNPLGGPTGDTWDNYLKDTQRALHSSTLADKEVFLGIDIKRRGSNDRLRSAARGIPGARRDIEAHATLLNSLADIVAQPGMEGRPATTTELEWLVHRSIRLGMPAPVGLSTDLESAWEQADMPTFTDGVDYRYKRFAPTVEVSADYRGHTETRHVAVMTIGRMNAITIPQRTVDPWMQATDKLGFPVEWASTFRVISGRETAKQTARKRMEIRNQQRHYREHDLEEPLDLQRKAEQARQIEDETTEGDLVTAARCYGWHRLAIAAPDAETALRRVNDVKALYESMQIDVQHPHGIADAAAQMPLLHEFVPGQPVSTKAYERRLPALYLAAGLPHVSSTVGDRRGPYLGYTAGSSRRAFTFDPHYAMEVAESSGLVPIVGGLGSGKSGVIGKITYDEVIRGITTTVLDPSGPLAALTRMPALRDHSRHIDLVRGEDGILSPWTVIADPRRDNFDTDDEHAEAMKYAEQDRKALADDVVRALLPAQVAAMPQTALVLRDAIRAVGGAPDRSLWNVVDALEGRHDGDKHARDLANYLRDMADLPQSRLFFTNHHHDRKPVTETLLVLTMQGLTLPDINQPREQWSTAEQVAVPLLHLASHFATARAYGMDRNARKMVALDEAGMVGQWGSGKALFTNLSRDTRKWNIAALVASQNPADITDLNISNFISAAFVGRIEDDEIAAEALRLLRIKTGEGYESVLAGLSPQITDAVNGHRKRGAREFLVKDVDGHVEKVRIDLTHQTDLLEALNTTADPTRARGAQTEHPEPASLRETVEAHA